jgi:hypothetical protein
VAKGALVAPQRVKRKKKIKETKWVESIIKRKMKRIIRNDLAS